MQSIPKQVNYKTYEEYAPKYRFMKVPLNNFSGNQVTVTTGSQQIIEWKLPIGCYNLSRSYVHYELSYPQPTAGLFNFNQEDCFNLGSNVYFGTGGGLGIVDLNYANNFTKIATQMNTPYEQFIVRDPQDGLYPADTQNQAGIAQSGNTNVYPTQWTAEANNSYGVATGATNSIIRLDEPRHVWSSQTAATNFMSRVVEYPLKNFVDTLLQVDKDLYFPIEMFLRVLTGPGQKMGWQGTNTGNPSAGAVNAFTITVANIILYLAIEQNEILCDSIINKVKSGGLRLQIPYTTAFRTSSNSVAVGFQIQLTRQYGKRLKKMLLSAFNNNEQLASAYDNQNYNASKLQLYQTFLDNRPLQDFQLSCVQPVNAFASPGPPTLNALNVGDDWRENEEYCFDSAISNYGVYQLNWFHLDNFANRSYKKSELDDNIDDGLSMDTQHLYQVQATSAGNPLVFYCWATFVRELDILPNGPPILN